MRHGREWLIPENAEKPADGRSLKSFAEAEESYIQEQKNFAQMFSLYINPGSAADIASSLKENPEALELFNMQLLFYRGEIKKSLKIALKYKKKDGAFIIMCLSVLK